MTPRNQHTITAKSFVEPSGAHRVLILDDEPAILFAYRKIIENEGMYADISSTLTEAISLLKSNRYIAAIADVRLSGSENEDGIEFLKIVRESHPETKVILASGYEDITNRNSALCLGAEHYFIKPVQPSTIINALKAFVGTVPNKSDFRRV